MDLIQKLTSWLEENEMDKANSFIFSILSHADPQYYDPVKAHEYYLRTRELQGRQKTSDLKTQAQREGWSYSKSKIAEAKTQDLKNAADEQKAMVQELRGAAKEIRLEISAKLSAILERVSTDRHGKMSTIDENAKKELLRIESETQQKIDALPPIPKGISEKRRTKLSQERSDKLDEIRNESKSQKDGVKSKASEDKAGVSIETSLQKQSQREDTKSERDQLRVSLKDTIDSARENYVTLKDNLKAKYEADKQKEFEAIKQTVR